MTEPGPELMAAYKEAFEVFSKGTDRIPFDLVLPLLQSIGQNPTNSDMSRINQAYDTDESHQLALDSFLSLCGSSHMQDPMHPEVLLNSFRYFDRDAKQVITTSQLRAVLQGYGDKLSDDMADEFIDFLSSKCDPDKTGVFNYELVVRALIDRDPGMATDSE